MRYSEVIKLNSLSFIAVFLPSDVLLEEKLVEEDEEKGKEVAIEVVLAWLHGVCIKHNLLILLLFLSHVTVRLEFVHVTWLELEEE